MNVSVQADPSALLRDINALPERMRVRFMRESKQTAVVLEGAMKARLQRQLSSNATGQTVAGIYHKVAYDGNGYVVLTSDARSDAGQVTRGRSGFGKARIAPSYFQEKHVALWLEKGTRPGRRLNYARTQRRPFFYASVELEAPGHERRIKDAWNDLAAELNR